MRCCIPANRSLALLHSSKSIGLTLLLDLLLEGAVAHLGTLHRSVRRAARRHAPDAAP